MDQTSGRVRSVRADHVAAQRAADERLIQAIFGDQLASDFNHGAGASHRRPALPLALARLPGRFLSSNL